MRTLAPLLTAALLLAASYAQNPSTGAFQPPAKKAAYAPTDAEREAWYARHSALAKRLTESRHEHPDIEAYVKASEWMRRYPDEIHTQAYYANVLKALDRGLERLATPAAPAPGARLLHAYRSAVDNSVQPYAVYLPDPYNPAQPHRLDLVLHGRGATLTEVSFIAQHEFGRAAPPRPGIIEAHVFGRTNNAYRWAGEADVLEALAAIRARYPIDPARIVLRGFSMGGAGAWHLGFHFPSLWAAFEAGAGFNETLKYARQSNLPDHQLRPLRIYDAYLYARNGWNVPFVGYGGELDPQLQASRNVAAQLEAESLPALRALFLVGPKTEHKWEPNAKKRSDAFLDEATARPVRYPARPIRFLTYTPRYGAIHGFSIDALERQYERAELNVDGASVRTVNVARITLPAGGFDLDGTPVKGPATLEKSGARWTAPSKALRKIRNLQGPIDDAFLSSFVLVSPTGRPTHPAIDAAIRKRMRTFQDDFAKWMRGDAPIVEDTALAPRHIADSNLILFGEPSSNSVLRKVLPKLPLKWTRTEIVLGSHRHDAATHFPVLIYPNPLNPAHYVVLNTGHTFGEPEFRGTNALLFPRLGDWAFLTPDGAVTAAGLFDEFWKPKP